MKKLKHIGVLSLVIVVLIVCGIVALALFSTKNAPALHTFIPTPTAVPTPLKYRQVPPADTDTASWQIFTDHTLKYSPRYPKHVIIDARQSSEGRLTVFIFKEDVEGAFLGARQAAGKANLLK